MLLMIILAFPQQHKKLQYGLIASQSSLPFLPKFDFVKQTDDIRKQGVVLIDQLLLILILFDAQMLRVLLYSDPQETMPNSCPEC